MTMSMTVRASPRLRSRLRRLAQDRALVIDYFASDRCGVVVGDITAALRPKPSADARVELGMIEGVPVFAERRLIPLLAETVTTIDRWPLPIGDRLSVRIDRPEKWLEFLGRPGIARRWWRPRQTSKTGPSAKT